MKKTWLLGIAALSLFPASQNSAHAHGFFSIGLNFGVPVYYRPWCGYGYYYRPYAVYVAPPPVVVQPASVYQPVQVVQPTCPAPAPPVTVRSPVADGQQAEIERCLQQLADPHDQTRADAAVQLGRLHAQAAVDSLLAVLSGDRSPTVREAAARGLGLIGARRALPALQQAAQADGDRDVRTSARFACDVVSAGRD